jgi:hypothetical protein
MRIRSSFGIAVSVLAFVAHAVLGAVLAGPASAQGVDFVVEAVPGAGTDPSGSYFVFTADPGRNHSPG